MAQLPPKIPIITPNWPPFPHQTMSNYLSNTHTSATAAAAVVVDTRQPSWVDEFLDFTSARRGVHRRSISDSIAFLEISATPLAEDCNEQTNNNNINYNKYNNHNSPNAFISGNHGFDRLDDEQLMSMFSDNMSLSIPPSSSNPSTPSDQNSNNDEKPMVGLDQQYHQHQQKNEQQQLAKAEPGEVESSCKQEPPTQQPLTSSNGDPIIIDPKRVKRILANRQSAQRSRVRKLQYISELELSVTTLQTEVSALSPRVAFLDHQRLVLNVDNSALKQRIAALAQEKIFKDAHQEALKKEIERLQQVYHQQNLKEMNRNNNNNSNGAAANHMQHADKEELLMN
ncbi:hypothetical protein P3X46_006883 [Hevea brasiliensis]|uniref:BZIP domain-containing protein n=1 Tax=Hevea brasiliensis TaxID=3981 RepID=A0ABQ9MTN1_HEVBR|nr:basic leucine zipper 34-like [Hevea brasiliensis]KAJ9182955.1 hypothetical protein P3X46_006883 [Hevea brasiliensis]